MYKYKHMGKKKRGSKLHFLEVNISVDKWNDKLHASINVFFI